MVVVPVPTEVTRAVLVPVLVTVATAGLELVQVRAEDGKTFAVRTSEPYVPFWMYSVVEVLFREIPTTVTAQVAETEPP